MSLLVMLCAVQLWQQGASMPTPGYGFACVADGDLVYAIGGARGGQDSVVPRLAVEAYDAVRDTWLTDFPPLPVPRWYVSGAELRGRIYVIGGTNGYVDFRRVDRFDPATNTWDTAAQLPWARGGISACAYRGAIYAVGGYSICGHESYQRSVARFVPDGTIGHWEIVDSLGSPRSTPGLAVVRDRLYAVGGRFFSPLTSMEIYSPDNWQNDSRAMREARSGLGLVGYGDLLCAIGGNGRYGPVAAVEFLNTTSGNWYRGDPLHEARGYHGTAMVDNRVVVMGGWGTNSILGAVETDSMILTGIEEPKGHDRIVRQFGSCPEATVVNKQSLLRITAGAELYDSRGALLSPSAETPPGLYFLRRRDGSTRKLCLAR